MTSISTDITEKNTCKWQIYGMNRQLSIKQKWNEKKLPCLEVVVYWKREKKNLCQKKILRHSASLETYNICTDNHHTFVSMKEMKNCLDCLEMTVSWKREK